MRRTRTIYLPSRAGRIAARGRALLRQWRYADAERYLADTIHQVYGRSRHLAQGGAFWRRLLMDSGCHIRLHAGLAQRRPAVAVAAGRTEEGAMGGR